MDYINDKNIIETISENKTKIIGVLIIVLTIVMIIYCNTTGFGIWTCSQCNKQFIGHIYYGYETTELLCKDCAREYYYPFPYQYHHGSTPFPWISDSLF